jgi:T5SS/PEP-CTERM-associated repeat protein
MRFNRTATRIALICAASALFQCSAAQAQTATWTATNGIWSNGANWSGTPPTTGGSASAALTFGPNGTYTSSNDFDGGFQLNQLTFNHASGLITLNATSVLFPGTLDFTANGATNPVINWSAAGNANLSIPLNLNAPTTIQGAGTGTFTISGAINTPAAGSGTPSSLTVATTGGVVALSGGGTFNDGLTLGTGGYLAVNSGRLDLTGGVYTASYSGTANNLSSLSVQNGTVANPTQFNVTNGAQFNGQVVFFGRLVNSNVQATVSGFGSNITSTGQFTVASRAGAVATLTVSNGGTVTPTNFSSGLLDTSVGTTLITGIDASGNRSTMTTTGQLSLGGGSGSPGGLGTLNIQAGGLVNQAAGQNAFIGIEGPNAIGRINVSGTSGGATPVPSELDIANQFTIGGGSTTAAGSGQVFVTAGGKVTVGGTNIFNQTALGAILSTVNVSDPGSTYTVTGQLQMTNGPSSFTVQNGATATTGAPFLATATGSTATLAVTGSGSTFTTAGQMAISGGSPTGTGGGTANVNVTSGGSVGAGLTILGLDPTAGSANILVDSGGTFTSNGEFQVAPPATAGGASAVTSQVTVQGGGSLTVVGNNAFFAIGTGSTATLNVTGANSVFKTTDPSSTGTGQIQFGGSGTTTGGTATVNISNGGLVQSPSLVALFANATVNVNSGGTLTSPAVSVAGKLVANGTVNGNVTANSGGLVAGTSGISGSLGTINGSITANTGSTLRPGDGSATGTGILTVSGAAASVTMSAGSNFSLVMNGPTAGVGATGFHNRLQLSGGATMNVGGATLQTSLGYAPSGSDVVTFIQGGNVTNTFAGLPDNTLFQVGTFNTTNYFATIHYTPNTVFLSGFSPVPEPLHILAIGGLAIGGFGWWKRRKA